MKKQENTIHVEYHSYRKKLWNLIAQWYIDVEPTTKLYKEIADILIAHDLSIETLEKLNREEVFPVLHNYLNRIYSNYNGIDFTWLQAKIINHIEHSSSVQKQLFNQMYETYQAFFKDDYEAVSQFICD